MKKLLIFALGAVSAISLASCNNGSKDTSHTIQFWNTMGANLREVLDPAIEQFEADNPGWTIEATQIGSYDDVRNQTISYIAAGSNPDLVYCYPDHVAMYNKASAVVDLNQYINDPEIGYTQEQVDDFIDGYYAEGSVYGDGAMYTLPFSKSTEVLYYNKTFMDDYGLTDILLNNNDPIEANRGVPTWDSIEQVCETIKKLKPDSTPLGIDSEDNFFISTAEEKEAPYTSATGEHYLFNNEQNKETVRMLKDWYDKGYVTTQTILTTYTSSIFVSQTSYMSIGSTGGATHQKPQNGEFEVGIAPYPQFVNEDGTFTKKAISQGPSLCMLKQNSEEKMQMTWKFMKEYLLTTEFQAQFSIASGYNPVLESVYDNPVYQDFLNGADGYDGIAASAAKASSAMEAYYFVSPAFEGSSSARDAVGQLVVNVLNNTYGIDEAFNFAIRSCGA